MYTGHRYEEIGWNVKWSRHHGNEMLVSENFKIKLPYDPAITTSILPGRLKAWS